MVSFVNDELFSFILHFTALCAVFLQFNILTESLKNTFLFIYLFYSTFTWGIHLMPVCESLKSRLFH